MNKKVIFYNDTGFPYACIAAAIRSGILPPNRLPDKNELRKLLQHCELGSGNASIYDFGLSNNNEKCLALWSKNNGDMIKRIIHSFLGLFNKKNYDLIKLPIKKTPLITLGVMMVRVPWLKAAGFFLIHRCIVSIYKHLVNSAIPKGEG